MESFKKGHEQNTYELLGDKAENEKVKTSLYWKCWLLTCALVAVGVIVAAFLFVDISDKIHKEKDDTNEHQNKYQSNAASLTQQLDTVESPPSGTNGSQTGLKTMEQLPSVGLLSKRFTETLTVKNGGPNGQWLAPDFCPNGTFANGFNIKYHIKMESGGDDTALNAISLQCAYKNGVRKRGHSRVESAASHKGHWTGEVFCRKRKHYPFFLQRFALKVQTETKFKDNTMASTVRFSCGDLQGTKHHKHLESHVAGAKGRYGQWSDTCPKGSAICGIQTRVQGHIPNGDNTALNDVRFFCCDYA